MIQKNYFLITCAWILSLLSLQEEKCFAEACEPKRFLFANTRDLPDGAISYSNITYSYPDGTPARILSFPSQPDSICQCLGHTGAVGAWKDFDQVDFPELSKLPIKDTKVFFAFQNQGVFQKTPQAIEYMDLRGFTHFADPKIDQEFIAGITCKSKSEATVEPSMAYSMIVEKSSDSLSFSEILDPKYEWTPNSEGNWISSTSNLDGVCKHFGFSRAVGATFSANQFTSLSYSVNPVSFEFLDIFSTSIFGLHGTIESIFVFTKKSELDPESTLWNPEKPIPSDKRFLKTVNDTYWYYYLCNSGNSPIYFSTNVEIDSIGKANRVIWKSWYDEVQHDLLTGLRKKPETSRRISAIRCTLK